MFQGRNLLIATKHKKEEVIAPVFEKALGVKCFVLNDFDTDVFGTFSGEIERKDDPISTLRNKCLKAMEASSCDLAVASEGSFGSHPSSFFSAANEELLIFIDKKNELEIISRELSLNTNFNGEKIYTEDSLIEFAKKVNFPSHGLILRKSQNSFLYIEKGIIEWESLKEKFNFLNEKFGSAFVETDMRALYNPTRMKVIKLVAEKLVEKINCLCPACQTPGFSIIKAKPGLPCELCSFPTQSTLSFISECSKCSFTSEQKYPHGKKQEDPTYCNYCNP